MAGIAQFVLRHKLAIALLWLVIFLAGAALSGKTTDRLNFDFSLPGQDGYETAAQIAEAYGTESDNAYLMVLAAPNGERIDDAAAAATYARVAEEFPQIRVIDKTSSGGNSIFSTESGDAQFAYAFTPLPDGFDVSLAEDIDESLKAHAPSGTRADMTGLSELAIGDEETTGESSVWVETAFGALGALAVLAFVFASLLALLPLLIAAVAICATFLILLGVTYVTDVSFIVQYLVSLVGLGVAIDYSLLIVNRWREERDHGRTNHDAVVVAMQTAGHAVVFSGLTVAISLCALVVLPVPFLQSIGYGGLLIPLVSVLVSITLLPVMLAKLGPRIDWPKIRHEDNASKFWMRWGKLIVNHRVPAVLLALVILGALIAPVSDMRIGNARSDSLAQSGPAFDALASPTDGGVPHGVLTPMQVLSTNEASSGVVTAARSVAGVTTAFVEQGPSGMRNGQALTLVVPELETIDASTTRPVEDLKRAVGNDPGVVGVAGIGPTQLDFLSGVYGNFPLALAIILLVTFVLLARAFRSLLLPLKAVILNLASLAATFGAVTLFWQMGYGSELVYDIQETGAITFWIPIMVFAFLFGLSMDYEVFILARMREEWDRDHDTRRAVVTGLGRTGRLVTSAALILFLAFFALSTGPGTDVKLLATALGFGILLDATVIRMLLVPALVSLFGSWNWWMPAGVAKVLRIEPSPRRRDDRSEALPRPVN